MIGLTKRQQEVLAFLSSFQQKNSFAPTVREIAQFLQVSTRAAHDHLKALERKGYLTKESHRSRTIDIVRHQFDDQNEQTISVPLLGRVVAGVPISAEEHLLGTLKLPKKLFKTGEYFALYVRGESMINAGIHDGDIAVIRSQSHAENGQIVVAQVEEAVTLKRFFREPQRIRLMAENDSFAPIYSSDVRILGKLSQIIRSYS